MNPVNATSLYVSASRSVLQCDPRDPRSLAELCRLLPFFRQSLSCLVCGNLLQDPIAPTDSSCQHYVCRGCRGQRMQLKPSCSWCKDYSRFEENRQLSLLVHCYRKLCLYITQSPLAAHIASAAGDSPDLQAVLTEGLMLAEIEPEPDTADDASDSYAASTSDEAPPTSTALAVELSGISVNGLHDCNGLLGSDRLQPVAMETRPGELPACVGGAREAALCDITGFGEELKHGGGGGSLLLSVEEVLRTLETDSAPPPPAPPPPLHQASLNGPRCPSDPPDPSHLTSSLPPENCPRPLLLHPHPHSQPPPPANCPPHTPPSRCHRKRSRSESDSGKLQPLPLASLLPPTTIGANSSPHHHHHQHHHPHHHHPPTTTKQDPKFPALAPPPLPHPHLAPVPNGGPPKVGKTVLVSNKAGLKKTVEHHGGPKKAYTKVRQGAPKPRQQPRDRGVPPHPHTHPLTHPPSPSKPLYKKPVEKKGCKCGRATQNPSVLTCRGQRCPCYSNRKACLDCICRGCQNSYMANGEKKLEAFAVPEKALEQTRLTLGINLTSITAAALRSPATSAPANALLNVATATGAPVTATFLSGAGHDGRGFDEPLEMRFDC